jgi:hypothetical protein
MNHICTWLCADRKGEESNFPQSGRKSSSQKHQDIYWRCLIVFFITSKRFHKVEQHLLYTNLRTLPALDGTPIADLLSALDVEVVYVEFKHKTPKGYFGAFQNQFFEFSILEHIAKSKANPSDLYLILDSDCIFVQPARGLFKAAQANGYISFEIDSPVTHKINGLSRMDMKVLFAAMLGKDIDDIPPYHLGEFLLCNAAIIRKLYQDFSELWPQLLLRYEAGKPKLNEEAHTLSYLFYKNGFQPSTVNPYIKRIWTNPVFYRNVSPEDANLVIWHLPAEKTFGIAKLYRFLIRQQAFGTRLSKEAFTELLCKTFGIPSMSSKRIAEYYIISYYKALRKRLVQKLSF